MGAIAQAFAETAVAIGPVATCIVVVVPCAALIGCVWLVTRLVEQIVAKAVIARLKNSNGELEVWFRNCTIER